MSSFFFSFEEKNPRSKGGFFLTPPTDTSAPTATPGAGTPAAAEQRTTATAEGATAAAEAAETSKQKTAPKLSHVDELCQDDADRRRQLEHDIERPAQVRGRHLVEEERHCLVGEADADAERDAAEHERDDRRRSQGGRRGRHSAVVEEAGAGGHGGADEEGEAGDKHRGLAAAPVLFQKRSEREGGEEERVREGFKKKKEKEKTEIQKKLTCASRQRRPATKPIPRGTASS